VSKIWNLPPETTSSFSAKLQNSYTFCIFFYFISLDLTIPVPGRIWKGRTTNLTKQCDIISFQHGTVFRAFYHHGRRSYKMEMLFSKKFQRAFYIKNELKRFK
jgi:hypothetical protein